LVQLCQANRLQDVPEIGKRDLFINRADGFYAHLKYRRIISLRSCRKKDLDLKLVLALEERYCMKWSRTILWGQRTPKETRSQSSTVGR
jgi:hypothetical protein